MPSVISDSGIVASAAGTYGNYQYEVQSNGTVQITKYTGSDTSITLPSRIDGKDVTSISQYAFNGNTTIRSISLPGTFTTVPSLAFYGCYALETVTLPDTVTEIGSYAFEFCDKLTTVNVRGKLKEIYNGAFYSCYSLSNFKFGNDLISVGNSAFINTGLKSATLPDSVTSLGDRALGFNYKNSTFIKTDDFTIKGAAGSGAETYAEENGFEFIKTEFPLKNNSTVSAETITLGQTVTLNAVANGGTAPYTYALMYKKASSSTCLKIGEKYGSTSTGSFKPGSAVPYDVMINVKDSTGKIVSKSFKINVSKTKALTNNSTVSSENITLGEKVTLTAKAVGGTAPYTYALLYKKASSSTWSKIGEKYGTESTGSFKPGAAVPYDVQINVKDSTGKVVSKKFKITVNDTPKELTNNSTVSAETITLGEKVTLTAKAVGGTAPYTYALLYKKASSSTWSKIGEKYGTESTGSFKPGAAVPYDVQINVKDSTGKIVSKSFKITVNTGSTLKNTSTVLSLGLIYGEDLCVIPKAEGGTAPYKMIDYGVKETSDSEWEYALEQRELTGKDEDDMIKFKFGSIGEYDFKIIVGDSSGKTAEKIFKITVEPLV